MAATETEAPKPSQSGVKEALKRKAALYNERSSWDPHWKEIALYQMPRASRFTASDRNKGTKRHNEILDNTAIFARRTLSAGLMSGVTSPARPWFRLSIKDRELMKYAPVRDWLHDVTQLQLAIFAASNTYQALPTLYAELGAFGTAACFPLKDYDNVLHLQPLTIGEYALACDSKGRVNTIIREFEMTVGQLVGEFGRDNVSLTVRNMFDRGNLDSWVPVYHMVQPNPNAQEGKLLPKHKKFHDCYFEPARQDWDRYLREGGADKFRPLVPRWDLVSNNLYGDSPGMDCLGDSKQLQQEQLRKAQGIDYKVNPPLQVPLQYRDKPGARLPGGLMYVDQAGQGNGVRSAWEVDLDLGALREDINDVRERIRSAYFADLFLMMANDSRSGITATEVAERHEEKLLALGPVLERLHTELLSPLVDTTFDYCAEAKILPPIPKELEGQDLDIEFISVLAQAQKMVASGGVDNVVTRTMQLAQTWPEVRHKIDAMQVVDDLGEMYGVNPKIIRPTEDAKKAATQEQQAMQAQQAAAAMPAAAGAAKDVSEVDAGNLQDVMSLVQGYSTGGAPGG